MADKSARDALEAASAAVTSLARDWVTLWQSELAAIAADPEAALVLQSLLAASLRPAHGFDRSAGSDAAARSAPAGAAAGPGDAVVDQLRDRIGELERRLAEIDCRPDRRSVREPDAGR